MQDNHFNTLVVCMFCSGLGLIVFTLFDANPKFTMAVGLAPLVYYHFIYLFPKAKIGLTQAAIDSVYYFGFLITVTALAISAISIANSNNGSLSLVILQFGIGLIATAYAVVARMHLSSIASTLDEVNQELLLKNYVQKSLELINNIEMASSTLTSFSSNIMNRTESISRESIEISQRAMVDVARIFEQEMQSTLALTREGLLEIKGLVKDTAFLAERSELQNSIKQTIQSTQALNTSYDGLIDKIKSGTESFSDSLSMYRSLNESLVGLSETINEYNKENGTIKAATEALLNTSSALSLGTKNLQANIQAFDELSEALNASIRSSTDEAKDLASKTTRFKAPTQRLLDLLEASSKVDEKLDSLGENFDTFGKQILLAQDTLVSVSANIKTSINQSNASLEENVQNSSKAATQLTNQLIQLTQEIINSTNKVQGAAN